MSTTKVFQRITELAKQLQQAQEDEDFDLVEEIEDELFELEECLEEEEEIEYENKRQRDWN